MELLDTKQVAKMLRRSERTVRQWCKSGLLGQQVHRIAGRWVITEKEVRRFRPPPKGRPKKKSRR